MMAETSTADLDGIDGALLDAVSHGDRAVRGKVAAWFECERAPGEAFLETFVRAGLFVPAARRIVEASRACALPLPSPQRLFTLTGSSWLAELAAAELSDPEPARDDDLLETVPGLYFSNDTTVCFQTGRESNGLVRTAGSYNLYDRIGGGPTGAVHAAASVFGGDRVALKLIATDTPAGSAAAERFFNGAAVAQHLGLPGCHGVVTAARDFGHAYLVSPLVGGSVQDYFRSNPPAPAKVTTLCAQAARALAGVHAAGYAHGNVKAGNLLLGPAGVVLSDFALPVEALAPMAPAVRPLQRADVTALVRVYADLLGRAPTPLPAACRDVIGCDPPTAASLADALDRAVTANTVKTTSRMGSIFAETVSDREMVWQTPEIGDVLGKCRLTRKIGEGATGAVFRADHQTLGIEVAVKVLSTVSPATAELADQFGTEARMLARLNHPNIVRIWDFEGRSKFPPFLVLELVAGQTLDDLIQARGALPAHEAVPLFTQVAAGLGAAYRQAGLIHRDIKPANILLGADGAVKVADLGLASILETEQHLTAKIAGTLAYMAPEQADGVKAADHRSDIYALGVTMYHAVTGSLPFVGKSRMAVMLMHASTPPVPPNQRLAAVPAALSAVIVKMMAKLPQDRFQTYEDLLAALAGADATGGSPSAKRASMIGRLFGR